MSLALKKFLTVIIGLFALVFFALAVLTIWDFITTEVAKEAFLKTVYTLGSIVVVSLVMLFVSKLSK